LSEFSNKLARNFKLQHVQLHGHGKSRSYKHETNPLCIRIRIYSSFECEAGRGARQPYSQLLRGAIACILTELYKTKMTVKEQRCITAGDPYCEFEAKPEE